MIGGAAGTQEGSTHYNDALTSSSGDPSVWIMNSSLPNQMMLVQGAVFGGRIWIAGGKDQSKTNLSTVAVSSGSGNALSWNQSDSLPDARAGGSMVVFNNSLYYIGGAKNDVAQTTVYMTSGGAWSTVGNLPAPRTLGTAVSFNNSLYYLGGQDDKEFSSAKNTIFKSDNGIDWSTWQGTLLVLFLALLL